MKKHFITKSARETKKLGKLLAKKLLREPANWQIVALQGELGSGKTTFTQGLLQGLGIKGPYTSPTFLVIKNYKKEFLISKSQFPNKFKIQNLKLKILNTYHIDAYRVTAKDILNLGWKEIVSDKNNIIIIEWADRIRKIIPRRARWIRFQWMDKNKREIIII